MIARIFIDITMTILILFALAFRITGDVLHEWIGVVVYILFIIHNVINRHWYKQIFAKTKKRSFNWKVNTIINLLLLILMSVILVTGLVQSKSVLGFFNLSGSMLLRQVHSIASYWGYILISVHLGMHWQMLSKHFFSTLVNSSNRRFYRFLFRAIGLLMAASGMWAFIERDMYSKLLLGMSFDFWDRSTILFFIYHLLIMALFVWITFYILNVIFYIRKTIIHKDN